MQNYKSNYIYNLSTGKNPISCINAQNIPIIDILSGYVGNYWKNDFTLKINFDCISKSTKRYINDLPINLFEVPKHFLYLSLFDFVKKIIECTEKFSNSYYEGNWKIVQGHISTSDKARPNLTTN